MPPPRHAAGLRIEPLEDRDVPSSTPLLIEPFQTVAAGGLPTGWTQWTGGVAPGFQIDRVGGLGDAGQLTAAGRDAARAWVASPFSADVETTAAVYLNSLAPVQLFARGQNLNTTTPTYYAVAVTRGAEVQLLRVTNGQQTVIGRVRTDDYFSSKWAQVTLRAEGSTLSVQFRNDTGKFLDSAGAWVSQPVNALVVRDTAVTAAGQVGFARGAGGSDRLVLDSLRVNRVVAESRDLLEAERFDGQKNGALPPGWQVWDRETGGTARTTPDQTLRLDGSSPNATRLWLNQGQPADVQVSSSLYVDSLVPARLIARGQSLNTDKPTYYAASVSRGLTVQLVRVVNGAESTLASLKSRDYVSAQWLQVSLVTKGNEIRVQVFRTDTSQYLRADGTWGLAPAWALARADNAIRAGGVAGLGRAAGVAGTLTFDNFVVTSAPARWDEANPIPTQNDKPTPTPPPPDDSGGNPTTPPTNGNGNGGNPTTPPATPGKLPSVPQNLPWIRLANLAYHGTPFGTTEKNLLRDAIDLVVPNAEYLDTIASVSPTTPQFVYTNVSNIYLGLLTDWLAYADARGLGREAAFLHATAPVPYSGASASSVPVNRFWGAYRGSDDAGWDNDTSAVRNASEAVSFAPVGQALALGYTDRFREINVSLRTAAGSTFRGVWEYVTRVDSQGNPTAWATLATKTDGTNGLRRTGQITFDPPRNWVAATVGGSARLFYVRFRTTAEGAAPVAYSLLGRDFTNSKGANSGTVPAFDKAADKDGDGYLNDAEWAARRKGFEARFVSESRVFYPNYGAMRYATNVSNAGFRAWAADFHDRFLKATPLARGFFVDNSMGKLAVDPDKVAENLANYSNDYGSLLGAINNKLMASGKWLIANTSGAGISADPIVKNGVSYLEEFALRPMSANHVQFDDLAAMVDARRQLSGGKAYEILDSLPNNGFDANNPRTQVATLAMYYLLADPKLSMLMMNGGNEPASGWDRHFTKAANVNVGRPVGTRTVFATGDDPANKSLDYKVYARQYTNALVLYKPLSYTRGVNGTTADNTATTHSLGGTYRQVNADGTLGAKVTSIRLRNGEGAVLVKA